MIVTTVLLERRSKSVLKDAERQFIDDIIMQNIITSTNSCSKINIGTSSHVIIMAALH
jgi:hypothetical protein